MLGEVNLKTLFVSLFFLNGNVFVSVTLSLYPFYVIGFPNMFTERYTCSFGLTLLFLSLSKVVEHWRISLVKTLYIVFQNKNLRGTFEVKYCILR